MSTNSWTITGNLGKDVEVKNFDGGSVSNFSIAVSSGFGDRKETQWVDVAVWGKMGEACAKFLSKGKKVLVMGELKIRTWVDKEGNNRFTPVVTARQVEFLSPRSETDNVPAYGAAQSSVAPDPSLSDIPF